MAEEKKKRRCNWCQQESTFTMGSTSITFGKPGGFFASGKEFVYAWKCDQCGHLELIASPK